MVPLTSNNSEQRSAEIPKLDEILVACLHELSQFPLLAAELKKVRTPDSDRAGALLERAGAHLSILVDQLRVTRPLLSDVTLKALERMVKDVAQKAAAAATVAATQPLELPGIDGGDGPGSPCGRRT
jgi:hypothetical protein